MMNTCCLILDAQPNSGAWNMAVDESLLMSAVDDGCCTVRIYRWSEPTVSLGYFQAIDAILGDSRLSELATVRRLSGGGAILHHHEITYSCVVPADHPAADAPTGIYRRIHWALIETLDRHGVTTRMRGMADSAGDEAFLCFSRGDPHDILCNGRKVVGSAQRRRRGAVLQHGSLLLRHSEHALEHSGMFDLVPHAAEAQELSADLGAAIAGALAERFERVGLSEGQRRTATSLFETKYGQLAWR